ncbi:phage tail spike protein [Bacillus thuringiensis]|uniref:Phage tail protein n=1 Tax=Bacillus thuringiensis serovar andalousiensis TaxID=257985 RepID=A0A6H0TLX0_BACTU|nr:phage tail spike protein [Bacillus thuringiensis]QIW21335.1 phage tail protein [Bacillus thuringiensis serovar andalousiensis]
MRKQATGDLHIVDFKSQRVVDVIQTKDYLSDKRSWQVQNSVDMIDIVFQEGTKYTPLLQQQNLILKQANSGQVIPYVITEVERDSQTRTMTVYAQGEWTLLDKDNYFAPQELKSMTAREMMNFALKGTDYVVGDIEIPGTRSTKLDTFMSPLQVLNQVRGLFGKCELNYRVTIAGSGIHTRYVDLLERKGRDTSKEITIGKDLQGVTRTENSEGIVTALIPFVMGKDADGNEALVTIESVNNGSIFLSDDEAFQRWNINGKHRYGFYTPETETDNMTPARLLSLAKTEIKKRIDSNVSYEVDVVDISQVEGFTHEKIYEGDTIRIIDDGFNPSLYLEARAIGGEESHKDPRTGKYTFGNYREIVDPNDALRRMYQKMLSAIRDKVPQDLFDELQNKVNEQDQAIEDAKKAAEQAEKESKIAKDLAEATVEYVEQNSANVIEQPTAPTEGLKDGKTIWVNNSDPNNKVMYLWSGGQWTRITPDTGELEKATADLQQEVEAVEQEISDIQIDINSKVDQTWLDEEMKKKANTDDIYTKDYVDKNLVGKQIYETDKQANIKAFSDMNTKYEQTAEALKLTATKEELKQTDQNVTNVTKTVNEVKISADENSKKIEKVEGDFKNMKIGSVNLAIESEFICDVKNATANYSSIKTLKTSSKVNFRNKKVTLSYILTGNITGKGTNPWTGAEIVVRYADDEAQYLSIRRDASAIGTTWSDALQSQTFTIKDKDVKSLMITTGSRDVFGNINISHVQLEEGTIPTAWSPATEESVSTGDFTKTTNEITQKVDSNTAKITKVESSFTNANYLVQSSANKEFPEFAGDIGGHMIGRGTVSFENDYAKILSADGLDSFYQIGNYKMTDLRGFEPGKEYTLSADLASNSGFAHLVVFQSNGTGWAESDSIAVKTSDTSFVRGSLTFKIKADAKGIILRIRFPMSANSTGKYMCFKNVKLEDGSIPTRWIPAGIDEATFKKTTNEIKQTVDSNTATISSLNQSVGSLSSKTNSIQQTIDKNSQTITMLTQTQGQHGNIIQQNTSDITQLNNQIKSKVSDTQMQEYVGGLGSTNLLFNAAFEDRVINASTGVITSRTPSVAKWGIWTNGTNFKATPESARNHDSFNSVKLETTGLTVNTPTSIYQPASSQANSGDHVFSAWFYTDNKALLDGGAYMEVAYYNGGTWVASKSVQLLPLLSNNSWVFVSATLPAPDAAHNAVRGAVTINRNGRLWVSQPQLQKGQTPSTFMENPKDYANYDQLVGEIAKKVATSDFNNKVTQMETSINQQSNRIDLKAEATSVYTKTEANGQFGSKAIVESHTTQLSLMSTEISLRVKSGEIASAINQTAQSVLIQASKIYLDGYIEAKHLKAQTLQGVTIQTAPQGSGANQIRLNAQNMTLYGSNQARGYFGFINRSDSNIQSALILGNDYASSGTLNGSLVIDQTTINGSQWTNSVASIGVATGRSGNDILKSSYINFYRYDGAMQINSVGDMSLTNTNGNISLTASSTGGTTGFITLSASKDIYFTAKRGYFNFYTSDNKSFPALIIKDLAPTNQGDVDFLFANQLMFRVARHPDYVGDGLQIKNGTGTSWANMMLGVLKTMGNIGCDANVYAKNFINTSTRKVKTNVEDLPFSALKKVNSVRIKQYNLISDVEKYNAGEIDVLPVNYGMIAEDTDEVFTTREKDAVSLYGSVSITMQAVQELDWKTDNMQCDMGMLKQELEAEKLDKAYIENQLSELKVLVNSQEDRIVKLEELLLQQLINKTPEQP